MNSVMPGEDGEIDITEPEAWYRAGLRFECQQCGDCCRIQGVVWVDSEEIAQMARYLGLGYSDFRKTYLIEVDGRLSLGETEKGECFMLDLKTNRCKIYPARPNQCSCAPFWSIFLASPEAWADQRAKCPGMDAGRLWTHEEILQRMRNIKE